MTSGQPSFEPSNSYYSKPFGEFEYEVKEKTPITLRSAQKKLRSFIEDYSENADKIEFRKAKRTDAAVLALLQKLDSGMEEVNKVLKNEKKRKR